jgi:hypothetical protein
MIKDTKNTHLTSFMSLDRKVILLYCNRVNYLSFYVRFFQDLFYTRKRLQRLTPSQYVCICEILEKGCSSAVSETSLMRF